MLLLWITLASILAPALWELIRSRRQREFPAVKRRLANLGIWLWNIIIAATIFPGRPQLLPWPIDNPMLAAVAGFLLLDALSYAIHRAQHGLPILWRFHALHHSDPDPDWTTSVRHHPVEHLIATTVFWLVVVLCSVPIDAVVAHSVVVFGLAAITHANISLPASIERLLRPAVVTLDAHLIHHSIVPNEANTNFGAVLNIWDRVFGTWRQPSRQHIDAITFGVAALPAGDACKPIAMLLTPWRIR